MKNNDNRIEATTTTPVAKYVAIFKALCGLFQSATNIKSIIGIDGWDTSNVKEMPAIFTNCYNIP